MPSLAQPLDDIGVGDVRALHLVAQDVHHLGDARHADAADADEVDRADVGADAPHAGARSAGIGRGSGRSMSAPADAGSAPGSRPVRSTRSARSRAACGPADRPGARGGIGERHGLEAELLHLLGELDRGEPRLRGSSARRRPWPSRGHWRSDDRRSRAAAGRGWRGGRRRSARRWSRRRRGR